MGMFNLFGVHEANHAQMDEIRRRLVEMILSDSRVSDMANRIRLLEEGMIRRDKEIEKLENEIDYLRERLK